MREVQEEEEILKLQETLWPPKEPLIHQGPVSRVMAVASQGELPHEVQEESSPPVLTTTVTGTIPKKLSRTTQHPKGPSQVRTQPKVVGL